MWGYEWRRWRWAVLREEHANILMLSQSAVTNARIETDFVKFVFDDFAQIGPFCADCVFENGGQK